MAASEYRDPDYPDDAPRVPASETDKLDKTREIIKRQFDEELAYKEEEIADIDKRMWQARRTLHRLRKTLVEQYYARGTKLTHADLQSELALQEDPKARASVSAILCNEQKYIHPTVRKFLGLREVQPDELFRFTESRSKRNKPPKNYSAMLNPPDEGRRSRGSREPKQESALKTAEQTKPAPVEDAATKPKKVPREDPQPHREVLTLEEGTRNRQKYKYRIIIGNTSKYAPSSSKLDRSTHKWLLYVRGDDKCPNLSVIVSGVTVHLHESYAPHHIVHLQKPPFHVSRRGWGEFPATIKLDFQLPERNRPAQLMHTIKLDNKCTGLQTLGAETIVDLWLYSNEKMQKYAYTDAETTTDPIPSPFNRAEDSIWTELFATDRTELDVDEMIIKPVKKNNAETKKKNDEVKIYVKGENDMKSELNEKAGEGKIEIKVENNIKSEFNEFNMNGDKVKLDVKLENYIKSEFDELNKNGLFENALSNIVIKEEPLDMDELQNVELDDLNLIDNVNVKEEVPEEMDSVKDCEESELLPVKNHETLKDRNNDQLNFLYFDVNFDVNKDLNPPKNGISEFSNNLTKKSEPNEFKTPKRLSHIEMDHCYCRPSDVAFEDNLSPGDKLSIMPKGIDVLKKDNTEAHRLHLGEAVTRISSTRGAVSFLLKNIPLVTKMSEEYEFRKIFPFVVYDNQKFWGLDIAKRRNVEWSRAKMINKILQKHFKDKTSIWRTKQILLFARLHGYCPIKPSHNQQNTSIDFETQKQLQEDFRTAFPNALDIDSGSIFEETRFTKPQTIPNIQLTDEIELACDSDDEIDITSVASDEKRSKKHSVSPVKNLETLTIENEDERLRCYYIEKKCMDIGIELRNEDVGSGYSHSAVHRVILQAVKCLAADVVRAALGERNLELRVKSNKTRRVWDTGESTHGTVGLHHVLRALQRDERLQTLSAAELSAERIQYTGAL